MTFRALKGLSRTLGLVAKSSQTKALFLRPEIRSTFNFSTGLKVSEDKKFKNPLNFNTMDRFNEEGVDESKRIADKTGSDQEVSSNAGQTSNLGDRTKRRSRVSPSEEDPDTRKALLIFLTALLTISGCTLYSMTREYTQEEYENNPTFLKEDSAKERLSKRYQAIQDYFFKPKHVKILAPYQEQYTGPYFGTLALELDETLIKVTWDRENGYRFAKRPGLERFLGLMMTKFEVIAYTRLDQYTIDKIIPLIDPYQMYFTAALSRDYTTRLDGKITKDLSMLNRDLKKVILFDAIPEHASLQPENYLQVPAWDGSPDDRYLLDILPFLETVMITEPKDFRPILQKYSGQDIPKVLAEKERLDMEELAKKRSSGLRRFLSSDNSVLPLTPMMINRQNLEKDFDLKYPVIKQQCKEQYEAMVEEQMKLISQSKLTAWESMTQSFSGNSTPKN